MLVLEDGQDYCAEKLSSLLEHMATTAVLTRDQILQVSLDGLIGQSSPTHMYVHCDLSLS